MRISIRFEFVMRILFAIYNMTVTDVAGYRILKVTTVRYSRRYNNIIILIIRSSLKDIPRHPPKRMDTFFFYLHIRKTVIQSGIIRRVTTVKTIMVLMSPALRVHNTFHRRSHYIIVGKIHTCTHAYTRASSNRISRLFGSG